MVINKVIQRQNTQAVYIANPLFSFSVVVPEENINSEKAKQSGRKPLYLIHSTPSLSASFFPSPKEDTPA